MGGYSFGVGDVDGNGDVGTDTTKIYSPKVNFWIDGDDFCHLRVFIIHPWAIPTKTGPMIHYLWVGMIILVFLVMVEVVLFIG